MTLGHELKVLDAINNSGVVDDMNDSESWAQASRFYEQLKAVVDMKDSELWVQGSRSYAQLKVIDDMKDSKSWA